MNTDTSYIFTPESKDGRRQNALARFRECISRDPANMYDPDTGKPCFAIAFHPEAWLQKAYEKWKPELATMPYPKFLTTTYWKAMRNHILAKEVLCQSCDGVGKFMHVHHKTYEFRGNEHLDPECLKLLCFRCHKKLSHKDVDWKWLNDKQGPRPPSPVYLAYQELNANKKRR